MDSMNSGTNGLIKVICIALIGGLPLLISAGNIEMHLEQNRFLDNEGNTIFHLNYTIPYYQLGFVETDEGFLATVDVKIGVEDEEGEKSVINEFSHYIGVLTRDNALSRTQHYLDKIELTLSSEQSGLILFVEFVDRTTEDSYKWEGVLENLPENSLISDLEFSRNIIREESRAGFEKFRRGDYQFYVDPTHVYQRSLQDTVFFYYEIQNLYPAVDGATYITEEITIYNDDYSSTLTNNLKGETTTFDMIHRIPADTLSLGYYHIEVSVYDRVTNREEKTEDYFVVSERAFPAVRIFPNLEDEYRLLRYFLPSTRFRNWDAFSDEAKRHFIDRFWTLNNPNPHSDTNEFMDAVRERIQYANEHFTHFRDGWETDKGRIYIRNGEPSEIEANLTDIDTKLTRKEYEIWRYRETNQVYLFLDMQGNGNFRLLYSRNDDMEHTASDWDRYLGEDFDMGKLQ